MDLHSNNPAPPMLTPAQMLIDLDIAEENEDIERLRAKIRVHEERIRELKSKRNASSAISKLHPEILQKIFHDVQNSFMMDSEIRREHIPEGRVLRWDHFAHVCRYWRILALSTATLWTTISNVDHWHWAELSLQRSGKAPLDVILDYYDADYQEMFSWQPILQHITHIRALGIYAPKEEAGVSKWEEFQASCHPALGGPLVLERLHVEFTTPRLHPHAYRLSTQWFTNTPRLQHLRLAGVDFNWDDIPFPRIRTLDVRPSGDSHSKVTVSQLLAFAKQMLIAEELSLYNALSPTITLPPAPPLNDSLPSLRRLRITDTSSPPIARLLSCIARNSALDVLNISVISETDTTGHAELFHALRHILQQRYVTLEIRRTYSRFEAENPITILLAMDFTEQPSSDEDDSDLFRPGRPFHFYTNTNGTEAEAHQVTTNFCAIVDFSYLRYLSVDRLPTEAFISIFGILPHLSSVRTFYSTTFNNLIEALTIRIDQPVGDSLSFPALRTITASYFNADNPFDDPHTEPHVWESLEVCLMQRCEYEASIEDLVFHIVPDDPSAESNASHFKRLEEIVPNVSVSSN